MVVCIVVRFAEGRDHIKINKTQIEQKCSIFYFYVLYSDEIFFYFLSIKILSAVIEIYTQIFRCDECHIKHMTFDTGKF